MTTKKRIIGIVLFVVVFAALLTVATIFDLDISKKIADVEPGEYFSTNTFGMVLETMGECPIYVLMAIAVAILFVATKSIKSGFLKGILRAALFVGGVVGWYLCFNTIIGYIAEHAYAEAHLDALYVPITIAIMAICANIMLLLIFKNLPEEDIPRLIKWAFVIICTVALANIITQIVKGPIGRMRFRYMVKIGDDDFSGFTKWYVINGKRTVSAEHLAMGVASDGFKSFPSGHTCAAGTVYALICLPDVVDRCKFKTMKVFCWIIPIIYTGLVAVSRIVVGAHYMSDVLVGGTLSFVSVIIFRRLFIVGFRKKTSED